MSRTAESFIPAEFDFTVGRLGDSRLGSHRLGGGIVRGIATALSRELTLPRWSETYAEAIDTTADQTLTLPRTSETFVEPIDSDADRGFTGWAIGGGMVPEFVDEIRDWQRLTLVFRSPIDIIRDVLRPLNANAGSLSQLREIQEYGWDIASHAVNGTLLTSLSDSEARAHVEDNKRWLLENGFREGAQHFVAPQHEYTADHVDMISEYHDTLTAVNRGPMSLQFSSPMNLPRINGADVGVTATNSLVDLADSYGGTLVVGFHDINSNPSGNDISISDFQNIVDHVASMDLDVITMTGLVERNIVV